LPISVSGTTLSVSTPTITWVCPSPDGGSPSPTCTATLVVSEIPGNCGSSNGQTYSSAPSGSTLCDPDSSASAVTDTNSVVNGPTGPWKWNCTGVGACGTTVSCSALVGVDVNCGTNATTNGGVYAAGSTSFKGTFCANHVVPVPSVPAFPSSPNYSTTWTCGGHSCTATLNVNGVCGPAAQP
jgi:hypothetical protein